MDKIKDKVVLITGAGKGSGKLLALAFAQRGAVVAANDISPVNVDEVVAEIKQHGGRAEAFIEDVAKKVGAQHLIKQVEDAFGRIDILVNHASVAPKASVLEMDEWDWHRVLDVNMTGAFLMTQSVGRVMKSRGSGTMINLIGPDQDPAGNDAAFIASMSGLEAFTHQTARELDPYGIRVHAVDTGKGIVERVIALLEES